MGNYSDIIVVGSGVSAVHAAYPIVQAGLSVTMLDVGHEDPAYEAIIPDAPFSVIRKSDMEQYRYFLGENFEGISLEHAGTGPQVTPPRKFVLREVDTLTPVTSSTFDSAESLAMGGLSGAWGAVCHPYLDNELRKCSLPAAEIREHYGRIANRIGISGTYQGMEAYMGRVEGLQPPLDIDVHAEMILSRYRNKRDFFDRAGIYMGRPLMAVLTEPLNGRIPNQYHDMDFWSNKGESVYRAACTVRELQRYNNFSYRRPYLMESFSEDGQDACKVRARSLLNNKYETFEARRIILAAGALGTTRIVLRSLNRYDVNVPVVCNPHTYIPCVHYRAIGNPRRDRCHSLAQLMMLYDPTGDSEHLVSSQIYSYRSLLLLKLIQDSVFPCRESLQIIRSLSHYLVIFIVQHEDSAGHDKYCVLRKGANGEGDYLEIEYNPSGQSLYDQQNREKSLVHIIRKLGCLPIKIVHAGHGASVHYAGQFPITSEDKDLTTETSGHLRGTRSVYVADGSVFPVLPAKGLTFTLMANADRIGEYVLREMTRA